MIPINWRDFWSSTTGTDPTLWSRSIFATFSAVSLGVQQIGSGVITSLTFMGDLLNIHSRLARTQSDGLLTVRNLQLLRCADYSCALINFEELISQVVGLNF